MPIYCKYREGTVSEDFCLIHPYNYMFVCNVQFCDFVMWTTKEMVVNRIGRDEELICVLPKAKQCSMSCIFPELLTHSQDPALQTPVYCHTCTMPGFGKVIMCMMCQCFFHYRCAQVKRSRTATAVSADDSKNSSCFHLTVTIVK